MTLTKDKNRFFQGLDFLSYALEAFAVIGFELLLVYVIENNVYGYDFRSFNMWQSILHWTLTIIVWTLGGLYVVRECARKSGVDLIKNFREKSLIQGAKEMSLLQWVLLIAGTVLCLISTWIDWNGSKVIREFRGKGAVLFTFQYLYYLAEVFLVLLIIVFGQYAFEKWFKNDKIPYGGIVVALTWGLGHWLTKGSLVTGIYTAIGGFVFGGAYLLTRRNLRLSYLFLCIMFIL
jgi:membrane protease YdiL (CAAX protease family)